MKILSMLLILSTLNVYADDKIHTGMDPEMMKKAKEFSTPGEPHKQLKKMVGKWNYSSKWWMSSDAKPEESKGQSTMRMILGGRFLEQSLKGTSMGQPFEGHGMIGYDNLKKEYETAWLDNMSTGMMRASGSYDEATKTLTEKGEFTCPMAPDNKASYRGETKWIDDNSFTYSMFGKGMAQKGEEFKMMELTYKRKK
ncbi:MAG TPA: DUF1579 domain-containing protein [Bacteriovoracaceae bacterium]|nr:DUF1579 domain-containing protein [Bacteriovoracaceae bacterium]